MHPALHTCSCFFYKGKKEERRNSCLHNFHIILIIEVEYDSDGGFIALKSSTRQPLSQRLYSTSTSNQLHQDVIPFSRALRCTAPQNTAITTFHAQSLHKTCLDMRAAPIRVTEAEVFVLTSFVIFSLHGVTAADGTK